MRRGHLIGILGAVCLVTGSLSGCTSARTGGRCIDYVQLPTPKDRYHAAQLVFEANVTKTHESVTAYAIYPEYQAKVLKTLKGHTADSTLRLISTSDQCETQGQAVQYLKGDPLAQQRGPRVLYLVPSDTATVWKLVVPGASDPLTVALQLPSA